MNAPYNHALRTLRDESSRVTTDPGDLRFPLRHIANLEEWLDELRAVERQQVNVGDAAGSRLCKCERKTG